MIEATPSWWTDHTWLIWLIAVYIYVAGVLVFGVLAWWWSTHYPETRTRDRMSHGVFALLWPPALPIVALLATIYLTGTLINNLANWLEVALRPILNPPVLEPPEEAAPAPAEKAEAA